MTREKRHVPLGCSTVFADSPAFLKNIPCLSSRLLRREGWTLFDRHGIVTYKAIFMSNSDPTSD
jgi:hypothetical protein